MFGELRVWNLFLVSFVLGIGVQTHAQEGGLYQTLLELNSLSQSITLDTCETDTLFYHLIIADQSDTALIEASPTIAAIMTGLNFSSFQEVVDWNAGFADHGLGLHVQNSIVVGVDTSGALNDFFGFTTLWLESEEPSIRMADDSATSWMIGANGSSIDGFKVQDVCAQKTPFLLEPSDGVAVAYVGADSYLHAAGLDFGGVSQPTAMAENGASGALAYWTGTAWASTATGANGDVLTYCNGVPRWGPCPTNASAAAEIIAADAVYDASQNVFSCTLSVSPADAAWLTDQGFVISSNANLTPSSTVSATAVGDGVFAAQIDASTYTGEVYLAPYANNNQFSTNPADVDVLKVWVESDGFVTCGDTYTYQGHAYSTWDVDGKCWFAENLRSSYTREGQPLTELVDADDVVTETGVMAIDFDAATHYADYGWMYNYNAILAERAGGGSLCPSGWSITATEDWGGFESAGSLFSDLSTLMTQSNVPSASGFCIGCDNSLLLNLNNGTQYTGTSAINSNYEISFWGRGELQVEQMSVAYPRVSVSTPVDITTTHVTTAFGGSISTSITQTSTNAAYIRCIQD